jgi:hypothetical protein
VRTSLLILVPSLLIVGLIWGALSLSSLSHTQTACVLGECPLKLHQSDSGKTLLYGVATRFSVFLDERENPRAKLSCIPQGVIGEIPDALRVTLPLYAVTFEAAAAGSCILSDDHFRAVVVIQ